MRKGNRALENDASYATNGYQDKAPNLEVVFKMKDLERLTTKEHCGESFIVPAQKIQQVMASQKIGIAWIVGGIREIQQR